MPELPEVETTRAGVAPHVEGRRVTRVDIRQPMLRWPITPGLADTLVGQRLHDVSRRAKYLLFAADHGYLCLHLGMSGRLRLVPEASAAGHHDHVDIALDDGWMLRFNDARRFGSLFWIEGDPLAFSLLAHLGPEPLGEAFDGDWLYARSRGRRASVKSFVMDSTTVVGVGNIYASEALHAACIHPRRPAGRISRTRYRRLAEAIRAVLARAIAAGGTTLRDFIGVSGDTGYFQLELAVYGREDAACPRGCGPIRREIIGQRSTFFCPVCQR